MPMCGGEMAGFESMTEGGRSFNVSLHTVSTFHPFSNQIHSCDTAVLFL